jgi:hypothetical protein
VSAIGTDFVNTDMAYVERDVLEEQQLPSVSLCQILRPTKHLCLSDRRLIMDVSTRQQSD